MYYWILFFYLCFDLANSVQVNFEKPDSGFFFKHSTAQSVNTLTDIKNAPSVAKENQDSVLSFNRFTVAQANHPVSIRATYGPFSTKQTVPARYIVPEENENVGDQLQVENNLLHDVNKQSTAYLDISASLVRSYIPRDSPNLRVLFHGATDAGVYLQRRKICILLHVSLDSKKPLRGRCMPDGEDNVCVAEVTIPSDWWPKLLPPDKDGRTNAVKTPQPQVQVSYSVFEPPSRNPEQCEPKVQIQPATVFATVPLTPALSAYKELKGDNLFTFLIPHQHLYPLSRIHIPVFLNTQAAQNIAIFVIRVRAKSGLKILGATASSDVWNVSYEKENAKQTVGRVTVFRNDQSDVEVTEKPDANNDTDENRLLEVFSWLVEVDNVTKENRDNGKIIWSISYVEEGGHSQNFSTEMMTNIQPDGKKHKIIARFQIMKDDIQAILPIAKNWELMNTAVLTGRQVYQAMKVFIVSQSGQVADITLQTSCHSEDESVIKVSTSCSSVYVDGTETEGSSNASITVKYGSNSGLARFTVWMPEYPLEVAVTDFRLSQIKGWKIPGDNKSTESRKDSRRKRANSWYKQPDDLGTGDKHACRTRYQQTPVEVYARFVAVDQSSGRVSSFISRKMALRITELVEPFIRVSDPKIATLKGRILQGRSMGRTDVQVLSPINGRVIGSREIRVGSDKVSVSRLYVRVVSGLQLNINPDNTLENGYIAETLVTRHLTAQYQEGLLDIDLEFSDGVKTPLRDVAVDNYFLLVESLDTEVVAFAPMLASNYPRVIAVGEGSGDLLRVTLLLPEECRIKRSLPLTKQTPKDSQGPLAATLASVQVDFNAIEFPDNPDTFQNDGVSGRDRKPNHDSNFLSDILIGIPLKDDNNNHKPNIESHHTKNGILSLNPLRNHSFSEISALEIGMYVLLSTFCFAIVIFVVTCFVYASKHKMIAVENNQRAAAGRFPILRDRRKHSESTTNAHNWVWLGRSTMDRSSMIQEPNENAMHNRDSRIRITRNPMSAANFVESAEADVPAATHENRTHPGRELPYLGPAYSNTRDLTYNAPGPSNAQNHHRECDLSPVVVVQHYPPPQQHLHTPPQQTPQQMQPSQSMPLHQRHSQPPPPPSRHNLLEYRPPVPPHRNIGVTANIVKTNAKRNTRI